MSSQFYFIKGKHIRNQTGTLLKIVFTYEKRRDFSHTRFYT